MRSEEDDEYEGYEEENGYEELTVELEEELERLDSIVTEYNDIHSLMDVGVPFELAVSMKGIGI